MVLNDQETVISRHGEYIGRATNNVGEWKALIHGYRHLTSLAEWEIVDSAVFYTDSQLVANQATGRWRIHKPYLLSICQQWHQLVRSSARRIEVRWIRRTETETAHDEANRALGTYHAGVHRKEAPEGGLVE